MLLTYSDAQVSGAPLDVRKIVKAPDGQGCPRCGGFVYAAEQMLAKGRVRKIVINITIDKNLHVTANLQIL